jgi:hypothetical protein
VELDEGSACARGEVRLSCMGFWLANSSFYRAEAGGEAVMGC